MTQTLAVQPQNLDYYNYFVMCNYVFNAPEPVIENSYTYEENGVLYCASATQKGVYCYSYARNNPLAYTDPSGEFLVWSIGKDGLSIGINFTPWGVPLGFGINIGWSNGGSIGLYGEVAYRVGGTGLGAGAGISQSIDYGFGSNSWTTTTGVNAYGSFLMFNAGVNGSYGYDITNKQGAWGWGVSAGVNLFGNDSWGIGLNVGYGSSGFTFGVGGYYNPMAWKNNPVYDPDYWNDDGDIQWNNNCYSYALDDPNNPFGGKPQPGQYDGTVFTYLDIDNITNAAINDGFAKKPSFWNKLGFGKQGYYEVYLVLGESDYHWYRQDQGGKWSHKQGNWHVSNVDASGRMIRNPSKANHNYQWTNSNGNTSSLNYNQGGRFLWIRKR